METFKVIIAAWLIGIIMGTFSMMAIYHPRFQDMTASYEVAAHQEQLYFDRWQDAERKHRACIDAIVNAYNDPENDEPHGQPGN